ncbi:MAG: HEPN domain-containing protein [Parcubacteria group bacterium]|jgi:uncharacterized protein (UPF0332 family)
MKKVCEKFIEQGWAKEIQFDFVEIGKVMRKAHRSIKSARILLESGDEDAAFQLAYEAMLFAGRALFFSYNLRPRATGSHKIVVNFVAEVMGADFRVLAEIFDNMRRKRNYLIYGVGLETSRREAKNGIENAEEFIAKIEKLIQAKNPQKKLL